MPLVTYMTEAEYEKLDDTVKDDHEVWELLRAVRTTTHKHFAIGVSRETIEKSAKKLLHFHSDTVETYTLYILVSPEYGEVQILNLFGGDTRENVANFLLGYLSHAEYSKTEAAIAAKNSIQ